PCLFQAEDGIRDDLVTGVQTCALPILAYALPYRRFVGVLTDANARLGADVDRYSFIVVDLHHLLLAGLPAHFESYMPSHAVGSRSEERRVGKEWWIGWAPRAWSGVESV